MHKENKAENITTLKSAIELLKGYSSLANQISNKTANKNEGPKIILGSKLFLKICLNSNSILKLLPNSDIDKYHNSELSVDIYSIATLTRNLLENFLHFHYVLLDNVGDNDLEFRMSLLTHHGICEQIKILNSLNLNQRKDKWIIKKNKTFQELSINTIYLELPPYVQAKIKRGELFYDEHKTEILERSSLNINANLLNYFYRLSSNYLHTTPYSLVNIRTDIGDGLLSSVDLSKLSFFVFIAGEIVLQSISGYTEISDNAREIHNKIFEDTLGESKIEDLISQIIKESNFR